MSPTIPVRGDQLRHLSQTDLADRWDISPRTLEKWRTLRLGPAYMRIGGRIRYRLADVVAHEAENLRGGQ